MGYLYLSGEEIRDILENAYTIKTDGICPACLGTGYENWNGNTGDDIKPGHTSDPNRCEGECENCDGIGYIF